MRVSSIFFVLTFTAQSISGQTVNSLGRMEHHRIFCFSQQALSEQPRFFAPVLKAIWKARTFQDLKDRQVEQRLTTRKPIGSHMMMNDVFEAAWQRLHHKILLEFNLWSDEEEAERKTEEAFSKPLSRTDLDSLRDQLVLGRQARTPEFQKAFPKFNQELEFVKRFLSGEDIKTVLRDVQRLYQSNRRPLDVERIEFREFGKPLMDDEDSQLPIRATVKIKDGVLHVYTTRPTGSRPTPNQRREQALDAFHELYEHLILPLDPSITETQLDHQVPHTLAELSETAFGNDHKTERSRAQFSSMPAIASSLSPDRAHPLSFEEFFLDYERTLEEIETLKFPLLQGVPHLDITQARQTYALAHAQDLHNRVGHILEHLYHVSPRDPASLSNRRDLAQYQNRRRAALAIARTQAVLLEKEILTHVHNAGLTVDRLIHYLSDPSDEEVLTCIMAAEEKVCPIENDLAVEYFDAMAEEVFSRVVRHLSGSSTLVARPTRGGALLPGDNALTLPQLSSNRADKLEPVWNPRLGQSGGIELLAVWEIRRALAVIPAMIQAWITETGVEFEWTFSERAENRELHQDA